MAAEQRTKDQDGQRAEGQEEHREARDAAEEEGAREARGEEEGEEAGGLSALDAVARAKEQIAEVTGLRADTVSAVEPTDGRWEVRVELVELDRLPPSTDVLATYHVALDERGGLVGYERVQRYLRSQPQ